MPLEVGRDAQQELVADVSLTAHTRWHCSPPTVVVQRRAGTDGLHRRSHHGATAATLQCDVLRPCTSAVHSIHTVATSTV